MFYFAVIFASLALVSANDCNVAPRYWCDTEEIATKCGVLSNCASRLFPERNAQPVQVNTYFESLCRDSIRFITTQLYPTWQLLEKTGIMESRIIPFGKATWREQDDGTYKFYCQHGQQECYGNAIENCVINFSDNKTEVYLPIVDCMEKASDVIAAAEPCVTAGGFEWKLIEECANGKQGNTLLHAAGVETKALDDPALNWVPWLTFNGVHTDHLQDHGSTDLLTTVCEMYEGVQPDECKSAGSVQRAAEKLEFEPSDSRL